MAMAFPPIHLGDDDSWTALLGQDRSRRPEPVQRPKINRPRVGLLSQMVIPSPTVQWVLPARLRNKGHNDVAFVGERCVQIKEVMPGFHLEDVITKSDFDANIMAAKVVSVSTELPWEAQMKLGGGHATAAELHDDLPPQIMVLTLTSRELVFLYYSDSEDGHFVHFRRPLPSHVSYPESFGRHVAVDPRSRAIAVAGPSDYFGIFMLRPSAVLQSQMAHKQLDPISEERFCRTDGDILFMEFLYPKSEDGDKIALLLLVSKDGNTYALCYEWDANESLRQTSPRMVRRHLPLEYRLPSIVVPLTKPSSFLLVSKTSMTVYDMLGYGTQPSRYPIPGQDGESQRTPLWTRWARPARDWLYKQAHDDIYLCREDGGVFYVAIGTEGEVEHRTHLGQLGCDVDSAFDILDIGHEGGDLILAAGNTGDGGLFIQNARDCPRCVQRFLNWAPITDSVIVESTDHSRPAADSDGDRLFACSASTIGRGALVEFRHGIEAQIGLMIAQDELSSTRDIWAMADSINGGVHILTSDPVSSLLVYLPPDFGDEICAIGETESGLNFATQTLAAGCTQSGIIIQVTKKAIHLGTTHGPLPRYCFDYDANENVVSAAIACSGSLVATAVRTHSEMHLRLKRVNSSENQAQLLDVGSPIIVDYEPVCLSIENFDFASFVFVGTSDGRVAIYRIEENAITFLSDYSVNVGDRDDVSRAIETIARISTVANDSQKSTLLCGLRSGILVPFEISIESNNCAIELKQGTSRQLGQTSVRLLGKETFALLTCGQDFWRMCHTQDSELSDYDLQRVWVTDQNNPAYSQKSIDVFTLVNALPGSNPDNLSGSLFCVTEGQLLICALDQKARTVPRRIGLPGSASKLTYSKHLKSLIVTYTKTEIETNADRVDRNTSTFIDFVDPDFQRPEIESLHLPVEEGQESIPWRPHTAAGEKITCLLDWTPERAGEKYHCIVIGTARKHQKERGRVIFLHATRNPTNSSRIECVVKHIHHFEGPVYAIAPYAEFTLMVATGYDIVPLVPKFSETRWERARFTLLSPAVSITVHEPYLYLSTARESLVVLKISDNKLTLYAHDRVKREGLSHFHTQEEPNLTISSSRGGTVSILTDVGVAGNDRLMPVALAEAHLPLSVTRLLPMSDGLYGTTLGGTVYRFLNLTEKEWRLLRFLQILSMRDRTICPFTPKRKRRWNPADMDLLLPDKKPSQMHVDGDILNRLVTYGTAHLRRMLTADDPHDITSREEASSKTGRILERFSELSEELLGKSSDPVRDVMGWLRSLLQRGL